MKNLRLINTLLIALLLMPSHVPLVEASTYDSVTQTAFDTVDDTGMGETRYALRFGSTLQQEIAFSTVLSRFVINAGVKVLGSLSGSSLTIDGQSNFSGALTVRTSITAKGTLSGSRLVVSGPATFSGATTFVTGITVKGNAGLSGSSLRVSGPADIHGALSASGAVHFDANLSLNDDRSAGDTILTFGNATLNQDLKYLATEQRFQFSKDLTVLGTVSGSRLVISGHGNISGSLIIKNNLSGAGLFSFGLGDCNNDTTSKLIYNPSTGKFRCATDQTGGGTSGGGLGFSTAEAIYVNQAGDTMTGALAIQNGNSGTPATATLLNVRGTMSGRSLIVSGTGAARKPMIDTDTLAGSVGINTDMPFPGSVLTVSGTTMLYRQEDPSAPPANTLSVYMKSIAGRMMLKGKSPSGIDYPYQPAIFGNNIAVFYPASGTTAGQVTGWAFTSAGTVSHPALASTNRLTSTRRTRWASATTSNAIGGLVSATTQCWRGNAAGFGGFFFFARFGQNVNTNGARAFVGFAALTTSLVAAEPSAALNMVGVGYDAADSSAGNWRLMHNDGSGVATEVDLTGAPRNTTDLFSLYIFAGPNSSTITVRVVNESTGTVVLDNRVLTTDLPTNTTFFTAHAAGGPAASAAAQNFELNRLYLESDY